MTEKSKHKKVQLSFLFSFIEFMWKCKCNGLTFLKNLFKLSKLFNHLTHVFFTLEVSPIHILKDQCKPCFKYFLLINTIKMHSFSKNYYNFFYVKISTNIGCQLTGSRRSQKESIGFSISSFDNCIFIRRSCLLKIR